MATAASPTPAGGGSHLNALGRRTSARQSALRRPTLTSSRPQLSRSESNPASQPQQIVALHDSSDDEEPVVPMKLSALTKALLNDGASEGSGGGAQSAADRPTSPPARPASRVMRRSIASASFSAAAEDRELVAAEARQTRRAARTSGVQQRAATGRSSPPRGGETSPAPQPRKRVVRLSNTGAGNNAFNSSFNGSFESSVRRSLSSTSRSRRQESAEIVEKKPAQAPAPVEPEPQAEQQFADINTPVVPVRTIRIAVGSSGSKGRSGSSSGHSRSSRGYSDHDQELPEDPATVGRPVAIAPQSSMRINRIGKMGGSFLSGPARRGRRRQSEEDGQDHGEGDAMGGQEPEGQQPQYMDLGLGEQPQSSFLASNYREYAAASGSPVSSRDPSRAAVRRGTSASISPPEARQAERSHLELDFKIPTPPPRVPSSLGKENHAPAEPKPKPVVISLLDDTKEPIKPIQPLVSDVRANAPPPRATSPDRKVLAQKSENTPRRAAPPPPPKMSVLDAATSNAGAATTTQAAKKRQVMLRVNGRTYTRIDCIGRGGSGKVYRVSAENGKMFALKRVSLESADENTVRGFKGEIDLLKRLHGVDRVIQLIDHELNIEKQLLSVLMEVGELDFNTLLKSRQSSTEGARLDPVFIRYYWKEMLECVQAVHAKDVVHSDLKPANFVLVQGRLKLIDFGIANAIQTEMTVNVHRETQIGTPNYMSPESLMDSNQYAFTSAHNGKFSVPPPLQHHQKGAPRIMKLGKPSDVWSLGCILYQMVYGLPPFGKIANQMSRCQAIINWAYQVEFPEVTEDGSRVPPSLIRTMRRCLNREQKERPTCDELLADTDPFLYPQEFDPGVYAMAEQGKVLPITEELLGRIIQSVVQRCGERMPTAEEIKSGMLTQGYWNGVKRVVTGAGNSSSGGSNSSR
ncbi:kinase-like domain-containing protein [Triangularia verruculosa]|uniref:Kinase-like domain-containing protein n=1 Tax=Triangularia verruculosa TaxID=2587418 RepID=A0AAN6XHT8_9PEZI|nr:kinase-like domain-containing protein [Triangularia verruculosa]